MSKALQRSQTTSSETTVEQENQIIEQQMFGNAAAGESVSSVGSQEDSPLLGTGIDFDAQIVADAFHGSLLSEDEDAALAIILKAGGDFDELAEAYAVKADGRDLLSSVRRYCSASDFGRVREMLARVGLIVYLLEGQMFGLDYFVRPKQVMEALILAGLTEQMSLADRDDIMTYLRGYLDPDDHHDLWCITDGRHASQKMDCGEIWNPEDTGCYAGPKEDSFLESSGRYVDQLWHGLGVGMASRALILGSE